MTKTTKKTILIAEDDEVLMRAMYMLLHADKNYTIASAVDGETALKMTERLQPDLVLLDLLMPKMNGFEYLKNAKSNPKLKDIPVIVLSNLGDPEDVAKAKDLGAQDYFVKADTDLSELAKKIASTLKVV